ncbi:unnamed protein product [Urochloa humidicola]
MFQLKVATMQDAASTIFNLQPKKPHTRTRSPLQVFKSVSRLADHPGDEVWFNNNHHEVPRARVYQPVPVGRSFYRIKRALPSANSPTIQEVDAALSKMAEALPSQLAVASMQMSDENVQPQQQAVRVDNGAQLTNTPVVQPREAEQEPSTHPATPLGNLSTTPNLPAFQACPPTPNTTDSSTSLSGVVELFSTPEQGLLPQPPAAPGKRGRRLKKPPVEISSLRRSKRQACSRLKHLPAIDRANHVLCRRLGYIKDDLTPVEQAIQEFLASFKGPLPQFIVEALTAVFHLDDDDIGSATAALIKLGRSAARKWPTKVPNMLLIMQTHLLQWGNYL